MSFIKFIAFERRARVVTMIFLLGEIMPIYSCYCELSQSRHKYGKKDAYSLYNWIVHKRGSKAKEEERKRQAVTREVKYNYIVI